MAATGTHPVVVIGVGNPYRRDDGVGAAVVARLGALPGVRMAGSLGETTELIELWTGAELAVVVDAVRTRPARPGRVHRLGLPPPVSGAGASRAGASSHAGGLGEAVELAEALGRLPRRLVLYAVEVADTGHGEGLSPEVSRAVGEVAAEVLREVRAFLPQRDPGHPGTSITVCG